MLLLRRIVAASLVVALLFVVRLFPDQNRGLVDIDLLIVSISGAELWLVLLVSFASGVGLSIAVSSLLWVKLGILARGYRKAISELEAEVHHLRNLPLASGDLGEPDRDFEAAVGSVESGR